MVVEARGAGAGGRAVSGFPYQVAGGGVDHIDGVAFTVFCVVAALAALVIFVRVIAAAKKQHRSRLGAVFHRAYPGHRECQPQLGEIILRRGTGTAAPINDTLQGPQKSRVIRIRHIQPVVGAPAPPQPEEQIDQVPLVFITGGIEADAAVAVRVIDIGGRGAVHRIGMGVGDTVGPQRRHLVHHRPGHESPVFNTGTRARAGCSGVAEGMHKAMVRAHEDADVRVIPAVTGPGTVVHRQRTGVQRRTQQPRSGIAAVTVAVQVVPVLTPQPTNKFFGLPHRVDTESLPQPGPVPHAETRQPRGGVRRKGLSKQPPSVRPVVVSDAS